MKFSNPIVIHYVRDMARGRRFYQDAFGVRSVFESPGWSTLDFGVIELALHILHPDHLKEEPLPHAGLNLEVERLEDAQQLIEAAGGRTLELREAEPGIPVRVAAFVDPDGNGFELRQNVGQTGR